MGCRGNVIGGDVLLVVLVLLLVCFGWWLVCSFKFCMVLLFSCVCRCLCICFYGMVCCGCGLNRLWVVGMNGGRCLVCRCRLWLLVGSVR